MNFLNLTLTELSIGGGSYGIGASAVDYSADLYTYLRITDINDDGTLNISDLKSVNDQRASKYLLSPNDIVFARTGGSTGRNYFYDGDDGQFVYAGFLIKFSIDPNKVNPKYIKYYCQSDEYKEWVRSFNTGSTRGNINAQTYGNMVIKIPPRDQQDFLVNTLSVLDEKIKNNNKINDYLEQMARAIFKFWFVDKPKNGCISDILVEMPKSKIKVGDAKDVKGNYSFFTSGKAILQYNEFLVAGRHIFLNTGGAADVKFYIGKSAYSTDTWCIKAKNNLTDMLYLLLSEMVAELDFSYFEGSALRHLQKPKLKAMEIYIPTADEILEFNTSVCPLFDQIANNTYENRYIIKLRDTLLPKLMSGELSVADL